MGPELLLSLFLAVGPNGFLVDRQLDSVRPFLPIAAPAATVHGLWIVFHQRQDLPPAFYSAPGATLPRARPGEESGERLLPALTLPRLFLYAPHYQGPGGPLPADRMAVDVAQRFFEALLIAHLDLGMRGVKKQGELATEMERRAEVLLPEVPASQRAVAYAGALAELGGHVLSLANEIGRGARRRASQGREPCPLLDPPRALFALWPQAFAGGDSFRAWYPNPAATTAGEPWLRSRGALDGVDRKLLLEGVLGSSWRGDPVVDFAALCAPH